MPGRPRENRALDESGLARLRTFPPADARRPMWRKPWLPRNRSGPGVVTRADLGALADGEDDRTLTVHLRLAVPGDTRPPSLIFLSQGALRCPKSQQFPKSQRPKSQRPTGTPSSSPNCPTSSGAAPHHRSPPRSTSISSKVNSACPPVRASSTCPAAVAGTAWHWPLAATSSPESTSRPRRSRTRGAPPRVRDRLGRD